MRGDGGYLVGAYPPFELDVKREGEKEGGRLKTQRELGGVEEEREQKRVMVKKERKRRRGRKE